MHVGQMGRVEHVVGDQAIVAFKVRHVGRRRLPFGMVEPPEVGNLGGVGHGRFAHPDPHAMKFFDDGKGPRARVFGNVRLTGNVDAGARRVERVAMIAALDMVADDASHGQGQGAVTAHVVKRDGLPRLRAKQHDGLVEDDARERLFRHLARPGGDIPSVSKKHASTPGNGFQLTCSSGRDPSPMLSGRWSCQRSPTGIVVSGRLRTRE